MEYEIPGISYLVVCACLKQPLPGLHNVLPPVCTHTFTQFPIPCPPAFIHPAQLPFLPSPTLCTAVLFPTLACSYPAFPSPLPAALHSTFPPVCLQASQDFWLPADFPIDWFCCLEAVRKLQVTVLWDPRLTTHDPYITTAMGNVGIAVAKWYNRMMVAFMTASLSDKFHSQLLLSMDYL